MTRCWTIIFCLLWTKNQVPSRRRPLKNYFFVQHSMYNNRIMHENNIFEQEGSSTNSRNFLAQFIFRDLCWIYHIKFLFRTSYNDLAFWLFVFFLFFLFSTFYFPYFSYNVTELSYWLILLSLFNQYFCLSFFNMFKINHQIYIYLAGVSITF